MRRTLLAWLLLTSPVPTLAQAVDAPLTPSGRAGSERLLGVPQHDAA